MNNEDKYKYDMFLFRKEYLSGEKKLLHLFQNKELITQIENDTGIIGGGFSVLDRTDDEIILLSREKIKYLENEIKYSSNGQKEVDYFEMEYHFPDLAKNTGINEEIFTKLINLLFLFRRSIEKTPDFVKHLFPFKNALWRDDIHKRLSYGYEYKFYNEGKFFLYCTAGEVYFFIICWAYLVNDLFPKNDKDSLQNNFDKYYNENDYAKISYLGLEILNYLNYNTEFNNYNDSENKVIFNLFFENYNCYLQIKKMSFLIILLIDFYY
jgi:hypothetical protein